jgi:hypothetical protein
MDKIQPGGHVEEKPKTPDDIYKFLVENWPRINKDELDLAKYFPKKRKEAEQAADDDLKKTTERLLTDIHDESLDDQSRDRAMTVSRTMARFAALLVVLSHQADKMSRENLDLQKKVVHLTWCMFWLSLVLAFVAAVQLFQK